MNLVSPFSAAFARPGAARDLADALGVLAQPTRLRILHLLHASGEMTISALTAVLPIAQPTVTYHVKQLASLGLVERRDSGAYALRPRAVADVASALSPWSAS